MYSIYTALLRLLRDGEERSEGPDAQCRENEVYYNTRKNTRHETQQKRKKTGGLPLWYATPLVGYPSGSLPTLAHKISTGRLNIGDTTKPPNRPDDNRRTFKRRETRRGTR